MHSSTAFRRSTTTQAPTLPAPFSSITFPLNQNILPPDPKTPRASSTPSPHNFSVILHRILVKSIPTVRSALIETLSQHLLNVRSGEFVAAIWTRCVPDVCAQKVSIGVALEAVGSFIQGVRIGGERVDKGAKSVARRGEESASSWLAIDAALGVDGGEGQERGCEDGLFW